MTNETVDNLSVTHLDRLILAAFERISQLLRSSLWEHAKKENLSPIQIQFLIYIASHPGRFSTVSEIAREFSLTPPTVSDAIKSLETKNLIQRMHSRKDKRKYLLTLTRDGQNLTHNLKQWSGPYYTCLGKHSVKEKRQVIKFLLEFLISVGESGLMLDLKSCFSCDFLLQSEAENEGKKRCIFRNVTLNEMDFRLNCVDYKSSMPVK